MREGRKVPLEGYEPIGSRRSITAGSKEAGLLFAGIPVYFVLVHVLQPDWGRPWTELLIKALVPVVYIALVHWYCMDDD